MKLTLQEIAELVHGTVVGVADKIIVNVAGLDEATSSDLSYIKDETNKKSVDQFKQTNAGAILVPMGFPAQGKTVIQVKNPLEGFVKVLQQIERERNKSQTGIHASASVAGSVKLGTHVYIGPHVVIEENVSIGEEAQIEAGCFIGARSSVGDGTHLHPHVTIREDVTIGKRCILHAGCVVGSDGYGFYLDQGRHNKIPQIGSVIIDDDVEIGSCTTIDRATTGATKIGRGTKIDNLVQVAHNVEVGENSLLVAQVGIGGSTRIGKFVVLAGQVGIADHVTIGDGVQVGAQSGVKDDLAPGSVVWGSPAIPIKEKIKEFLFLRQLPQLINRLKKLK